VDGLTVAFRWKEFELVDVTRPAENVRIYLVRIWYATHGRIVVVVVEIAGKRPTKNNLRAIREASRRRIPPSM
jgi:hypothetical protein